MTTIIAATILALAYLLGKVWDAGIADQHANARRYDVDERTRVLLKAIGVLVESLHVGNGNGGYYGPG